MFCLVPESGKKLVLAFMTHVPYQFLVLVSGTSVIGIIVRRTLCIS